jgi:hypothetical protein
MLQIAVTGKPNVGKSSFFNSATLSEAEVAGYPFTTIDANKAVGHVVSTCPCTQLELTCSPRNSKCVEGKRLIPVELVDVAGLVPGAHEGRGLGNKFLDDMMQAKVLLHIIDASGSTDEEGRPCEPGSHDPLEDINFLQHEIVMWLMSILKKNWNRMVRKVMSEHLDFAKVIAEQFSGIGVALEEVIEAKRIITKDYDKWEDEDIVAFLEDLLQRSKPTIIVANKADTSTAAENINRLQEKYENVIPASAESELALVRAAEAGLISYVSGDSDFEVLDQEKLSSQQLKALEYIREHVLQKYGSTGVQEALNMAVFKVLDMIVVYPVEDEHKYCDQKGNVLPDAILIRKGSKPRDLAYVIHTDIGESFMHAIDAKKGMRVSSDYELEEGDIISIVCR